MAPLYTVAVQPGTIADHSPDMLSRKVEYISADNKTVMGIDISSVYIADGEAFVIRSPEGGWGPIPFEFPVNLTISMATGLCNETLGHWSSTEYDPTFGILFTPDPATPAGKSQKGLNGSQIAAIAVVIPVVVIVASIAIGYTIYKSYVKKSESAHLRGEPNL